MTCQVYKSLPLYTLFSKNINKILLLLLLLLSVLTESTRIFPKQFHLN